jgi:flagellar hook-associated protein 1 FlgK
MGTISNAFSTISGALDADQSALNIIANNVANANTVGYTRENATFQENDPLTINGVSYGQGASQAGPTSVRDRVLSERIDQQQQLASASGTRVASLNTVQALFTPDSGSSSSGAGDIGADITSFFNSFSKLEATPTDNSLRQNVLSTATSLAGDISNAASSLNAQRANLDQEASGVTSQVNSLTASIAQLNQQITTTSPNGDAGTLEDQRQADLSQLSNLVGINQITTENNGLSITTTSGAELVSGSTSYQMTSGSVSGVTHFYVGTEDVTSGLTSGGGELGGYLTARDVDIPNVMNSLDQLAYSVSTQVNSLNNAGTDLNGNSGTVVTNGVSTDTNSHDIFAEPAANKVAGSALNMAVVMTDPDMIATAAFGAGTGDNSNAVALANLGSSQIVTNPTTGTSETPTNFYSSFVSALGSTITEAQTENTAQTASVTQLQTQSDSLSGVNLDDEASDMTTMERSYQAASQVFTMINSLMASTINLGETTTVT